MTEQSTETQVLDLLASMTADSLEATNLDAQSLMLVRIAALVAVDAPPASYLLNLEAAGAVGVDEEQVVGVLTAIAPIVGTARVASAGRQDGARARARDRARRARGGGRKPARIACPEIRPRPRRINHGHATKTPTLSDQDLAELIALTKGADSVELKLTVPVSDRSRGAAALGVDPLDAQIRQVYFFDTPDLTLNKSGVVVRARRVQGKGDDTVVKLRPVVPNELPAELRRSPNFGVEVDAMPGGFVCSGSMKRALKTADVRDAVLGKRPVSKLYSKEQRALYAAHAPEGLELDDLSILGPISVLKLKFAPEGYDRKLVSELWLYPDNSMILELSTKCAPSEAFQVAAETRVVPDAKGRRAHRRAGDQDEEGARVLLRTAAGRRRLGSEEPVGDREASSDRRAPPMRGIDGERASDTGHAVGHVRVAVA